MDSHRCQRHLAILLLVGSLLAPTVAAQSFCEPVAAEPVAGAVVLGNGTPGSISTAQLQAALDAGGAIVLDQGPAPSTIVVSQTLVASRATVLDGGGLVTLSGGDTRRIFSLVNPNPAANAPLFQITLQNLTLADAAISDGRGAAIYKEHDFEFPHKVSLKLVNCRFTGNDACSTAIARSAPAATRAVAAMPARWAWTAPHAWSMSAEAASSATTATPSVGVSSA